jgi:hypothetical protein
MDIKDLRTYQDPPAYARRDYPRRSGGVHEQPYNRYRGIQASPEQLTLSDALRDPEIATATNRGFSPFPREEPEDEEPITIAEFFGQTAPEARCDIPSPPQETPQAVFSENSIPFTLLSDEESGPEDTSTPEVLDFRRRRMQRSRHNMDDWEPTDPTWSYSRADGTVVHRNANAPRGESPWALPTTGRLEAMLTRARPLHSPSPDTPDQRGMVRTRTPQPAVDGPNVQAARFHIKRGKSRVTVKFDPLKMWAGKSNVDVQSVIVKGYAGPRFFPAMQLL